MMVAFKVFKRAYNARLEAFYLDTEVGRLARKRQRARHVSRTTRKPICPVLLLAVFLVRAATR